MSTTYDKHRAYWLKKTKLSPLLEAMLETLPTDGRIIDVGCGNGRLANALSARGNRVTGVDYSAQLVAEATEAFIHIFFLCADANDPETWEALGESDALVSNVAIRKDGVRLEQLLDAAQPPRCIFRIQGDEDLPGWVENPPLYSETEIRTTFESRGYDVNIVPESYMQKFTDEAYFRTFMERIALKPVGKMFHNKRWPLRVKRQYYCVDAKKP